MGRVEWAMLCDLAYFDAARNLCVIGVQTEPVPIFSAGTHRIAVVACIPGLAPHPSVVVSISTPDSFAGAPARSERVRVESIADHLLVTVSFAPLIDDGIYRFEVKLMSSPLIAIDLPILITAPQPLADGYHVPLTGAMLRTGGMNQPELG